MTAKTTKSTTTSTKAKHKQKAKPLKRNPATVPDTVLEEMTEEQLDEVIAARQPKRGRSKNLNYLSWSEAREFMRSEMLPSRGKFYEWYDRNNPKTIPRFPYRVYTEDWISWNDFLGTNNKFNEKVGTKWRPFLEANDWAINQGLATQNDWLQFCRQEGTLPADIPARPDLVYLEWRSWKHWLGTRIYEKIEAKKDIAANIQVYYVIRQKGAVTNVLTFGVEPTGLTTLKERWKSEQFEVIKLFKYDPEKQPIIDNIVNSLSTPYYGYNYERIVPNVWEILWHLGLTLDPAG